MKLRFYLLSALFLFSSCSEQEGEESERVEQRLTALDPPVEMSAEASVLIGEAVVKVGDINYFTTKNSDGSFDVTVILLEDVTIQQEQFDKVFRSLVIDFMGERLASKVLGNVKVQHYDENALEELHPLNEIHKRMKDSLEKE